MSETCSATTKRGTRCRSAAVIGSQFCAMHSDPGRAVELGRRGGRRNRHYVEAGDSTIAAPSTPEELMKLMAQAIVDVSVGKMHPRVADAMTQLATPLLRSMEDRDLQRRVERLEILYRDQGSQNCTRRVRCRQCDRGLSAATITK